jgi:hypothetical protein
MMGVPIAGPCNVFCDNEAAMNNSSIPKSTLKHKHNSIAYHKVRESAVAGILRVGYIHSFNNLVVMLTKPLTRAKIHEFCEQILC